MTIARIVTALLAGTALSGAAMLALAPAALAKGGDVRAAGNCSAATDWKLKAKADNGRLDVEYEIDSNKVGQLWTVTLTDNGVKVYSGSRVTAAPSGSFSVATKVPNRAGTDSLVATAKNSRTGETCRGAVKFAG